MYQERTQLPNATATLVLGIVSILTGCFCYGLGLIPGIIALVISAKDRKAYRENPDMYDGYGNLNAGRITAIIGIVLSVLMFLFFIVYIIILGNAGLFDEMLNEMGR